MITKELLIASIESADYNAQPYSGRNMYGATCVSTTVNYYRQSSVVIALSLKAHGASDDDIIELFEDSRVDNMGLDFVLYFPSISWGVENEDMIEHEENTSDLDDMGIQPGEHYEE